MVTGQAAQPTDQNLVGIQNYALELKNAGHDAATITQLMRMKYPNAFQSGSRSSNAAAINAQYMNANRAPMAQSAYPFGYDDGYGN
jgi:hypothetical protein